MKIEKGLIELKYNGVKNLQDIKNLMEEKVEKYKNIIVTEETLKECKETLEEIKPIRQEIKKFRAELNKELTAAIKDKLSEVDQITGILNDVIEPIEKGIEFFEEEKRIKKLESKKQIFIPLIENANNNLRQEDLPLFYELKAIEWSDEWVNKSDKAIKDIIIEQIDTIKKDIQAKNDRVELIKTHCKLLKNEWSLISEVNWQYLRREIYEDNWKEKLSDLAAAQQEQEMKIQEKIEKQEKEKLEIALKQQEQEIKKETKIIPIPETKENELKSIFRLEIEATESEYKALKDYLDILNVKLIRDKKL